jgi:toxin HigB-1
MCCITLSFVIRTFAHKGLRRFFEQDDRRGISSEHAPRIARILDRLDASPSPADMNLPGFHFHALTGKRRGTYSVRVSGNWRITFRFEGEDTFDVDLEDYH